jgi:SAM-dependent methyltransferase
MATLEENLRVWDGESGWRGAEDGEAWSRPWGGAEAQWRFSLLPRVGRFLPARSILEIAPGFGRWTRFLEEHCERLMLVDISARCIAACRARFAVERHISYFVNDGRSLAMIEDGSIDLVFSFDSLVHANADVLEHYLAQLARKLTPDGVGFIHHSNWGAYPRYIRALSLVPPRITNALASLRLLDGERHWRARDMTARRFADIAHRAGLQCIAQELLSWHVRRLADCISVFTRPGSQWARQNVVVRNRRFGEECAIAREVARAHVGA